MSESLPNLTLNQAVWQLRERGIEVSLDLGVHGECWLSSSCLKATEVRKVAEQAEMKFVEFGAAPPFTTSIFPAEVKMSLEFRSPSLQRTIDVTDVITAEARKSLEVQIASVNSTRYACQRWLEGAYRSYYGALQQARQTRALPQLPFTSQQLMACGGYAGKYVRDPRWYSIRFPIQYRPTKLFHNESLYRLAEEDINTITRQVCLEIVFNETFFYAAILQNLDGSKFLHYHGDSGYDCWGDHVFPEGWNKTLDQLIAVKNARVLVLDTINGDSLLSSQPYQMPFYDDLLKRATSVASKDTWSGDAEARELVHAGWYVDEPEEEGEDD